MPRSKGQSTLLYSLLIILTFPLCRRHVFSDLNPHVCTFEACGMKLFPTRQKWFEHELQSHRKEWFCITCQYSCKSADLLESRMRTRHYKSLVENQLPALVKLCEKSVVKISAADCPLCDNWGALLRKRMALLDP